MTLKPAQYVHFNHGTAWRTQGATYFANTTNNLLGIANTWSIAMWVKPMFTGAADKIFETKPPGSNTNRIVINLSTTNNQMQIQTNTFTAATIKNYLYNTAYTSSNWVHWVFTWDGTTLQFFKNGVLTPADTKTSDAAGSMSSTGRNVSFGAGVNGVNICNGWLHSLAFWNVILTNAEVTSLYNDGNGVNFDLRTIEPLNLQHWWLPGRVDTTPGKDYGFTSSPVDISANAVLTSSGSNLVGPTNDAPKHSFNTPAKQAILPFSGHKYSLDGDGVTDRLSSLSSSNNNLLNIGNAWTAMVWVKPSASSQSATVTVYGLGTIAGSASAIGIQILGTVANDPVNVTTQTTGNSPLKNYRYDSLFATTNWIQFVVTWDGTTLQLYNNGVAQTPTAIVTDNAGSMANDGRGVGVFGTTAGANVLAARIHSLAVWSQAFSAGQVTTLYNGGVGWNFNCYTLPGLQHWWLFGDPAIGSGLSYDRVDTALNTVIQVDGLLTGTFTNPKDSFVDAPGL